MNRHEAILKLLQQKQEVEVQELTEQLNVSAVTIRKDLNQLAQRSAGAYRAA
jgi:DeoR family transcriptional regulator of aga operon